MTACVDPDKTLALDNALIVTVVTNSGRTLGTALVYNHPHTGERYVRALDSPIEHPARHRAYMRCLERLGDEDRSANTT